MAESDPYERLADMQEKEDVVGIPKTPAFLKLLRLQFTPEEARLALDIGLTGGTLDEISQKTGIDKPALQQKLHTMADKGTVFYDPGLEEPTYKVVGSAAPGLVETGLWGNIKYPFSVELGKTLHQILQEWTTKTLCTLGFPFAPIWAAVDALPKDAQPSENLAEALKDEGHWSVSPCPCRLAGWLVEKEPHCEHLLETCLHSGAVSRWTVKHGLARELTYDEVLELLRKSNEDGLVHTLNIQNCVCNCCSDCCAIFYGLNERGVQTFIPSPFLAQVDEDACNACADCADRCPAGAIEVNGFASVEAGKCLGCGVCVTGCGTGALGLVRRTA
jgi:electron transport complex protein RnfB